MLTASDTAYSIALIRAQEAELPESERLFEDPYAPIFAAGGEHAREGTERFLALPFFVLSIRLRTRGIDDVVREAIAGGARQLVLMGAGFDARALRLPEIAQRGVQTFEIDFPALLENKRRLLAAAGVAIPGSVHHVACDFASDFESPLEAELVARGFERNQQTMFVLEGVLAYLTQEAIDRSLRFVASMGGAGSRLIFDYSDYVNGPEWAPGMTRRAGFTSFDDVPFVELWRRHLPGDPASNASFWALGIASR